MTTFDLNLLNELEKGYIIGLFVGDGSFNKGSKVRVSLSGLLWMQKETKMSL